MRNPNAAAASADAAQAAQAAWKAREPAGTDGLLRLSCELVSPLYGGGVLAGQVDPDLPIRPSALRGQLRFWWRLLHRRGRTSRALFALEKALWGGIGQDGPTASRVRVRVTEWTTPNLEPAFVYPRRPDGSYRSMPEAKPWVNAYAAFSAQGKAPGGQEEDPPKSLARPGLRFRVLIQAPPEALAEVLEALRWWASFGGVGARTRRGLGAVKVALERDGKAVALGPVTRDEAAALGARLELGAPARDANDAWQSAVGCLRAFRQGENLGRNPGQGNRPGRSLWPEADTLRELSGHAHPDHRPRLVPGAVFPRAAFGLPIIFHFKDAPGARDRRMQGFRRERFDPDDHVLEPADRSPEDQRERMASPLILRPYWDGQGWRPAALLLPGWERALTEPLKFKSQPYPPAHWPQDAAEAQRLAGGIRPMQRRGADPLSAFMAFFANGGRR